MSAFDDEFGLFDDEAVKVDEDEHRSTLGARTVSNGETIIDEIELEEGDQPRGRRGRPAPGGDGGARRRPWAKEDRKPTAAPEVLRERAVDLLTFLAKGLVSKPGYIVVESHDDPRQGMVLELEVAAEDLGKVIGRGGRVAQALRTVVRAGAEGRLAIEIIDVEDEDESEEASDHIAMTVDDATERALEVDQVGGSDLEIPAAEASAPDPASASDNADIADSSEISVAEESAAKPGKAAKPAKKTAARAPRRRVKPASENADTE